ncbi:MAG: hypothetical protein CMQ40_06725 [Gammaproteobacteria bacterium]|nr:hypothetical protein [Gammaproteobacteria bacterium]
MDKKCKVLQVCHDLSPPFELIVKSYAASFTDCDVLTIILKGSLNERFSESINGEVCFLSLPDTSLSGLKLRAIFKVGRLVKEFGPDLVIAHRYKPFFIVTMLNYLMSIPQVLGVSHHYGFLKRRTRSLFSRFWKNNIDIVGISPPLCAHIKKGRSYLEKRVHLVQQASERTEQLDKGLALRELGLPEGNYYYGTIGRLVEKKNHKLLLEAFSLFHDNSRLIIIGEGRLYDRLILQAERLGIAERLHLLGHIDVASKYLKAFDCFVFPSSAEEEFGVVLLEAMNSELPIVCSNAPGPSAIVDGVAQQFRSDDPEDLFLKMSEIRRKSDKDLRSAAQRGLRKLDTDFGHSKMADSLRSLPPVLDALS